MHNIFESDYPTDVGLEDNPKWVDGLLDKDDANEKILKANKLKST